MLFLPFWDPRIFHPPDDRDSRLCKGGCFDAWKWQHLYRRPLSPITAGLREIHRELSLHEMAAILRESEVFYSYDETALIHSATLCGCPAVLLPSDKFRDCHTLEDMGSHGIAEIPGELPRAAGRRSPVHGRTIANPERLRPAIGPLHRPDAEPRIVARGNSRPRNGCKKTTVKQ